MDSLNDDKINRQSSDLEVESEENKSGKEIEGMKIAFLPAPWRFMNIFADGEKRWNGDAMVLLWSAIAAGLSMKHHSRAKGIFHVQLEGVPGGFTGKSLAIPFGFIIVIMARQQLFTENTVAAVLPVMQKSHPE